MGDPIPKYLCATTSYKGRRKLKPAISCKMNKTQILDKLLDKRNLETDEITWIMNQIMEGQISPIQIGGLLCALRAKGETLEEITACVKVMREKSTKIPFSNDIIVDTCGTGGDASGSFNISTTVALLLASGGYKIAKHGNRSMTSKSGSADVLEALGVRINRTPEEVAKCIQDVNIGFMFSPALHFGMKHVVPVRKELKVRTIFNLLGPLTNPAGANVQIIGLYTTEKVGQVTHVLKKLGTRSAFVVAGYNGMDEVSLGGKTKVGKLNRLGNIEEFDFDPTKYGFQAAGMEALKGGEPRENAKTTRDILTGKETGPKKDIVVINAGFVLAAIKESSIEDGIVNAKELLKSGNGAQALDALINYP